MKKQITNYDLTGYFFAYTAQLEKEFNRSIYYSANCIRSEK
ncbi:hypothetical protein [Sphingobacterium daejeonense]|nr:hypothetical protein [Sphingobacterium daejeonense]VTP96025.1 Uncharacterised protein [Sphingobacterium daejeonense]